MFVSPQVDENAITGCTALPEWLRSVVAVQFDSVALPDACRFHRNLVAINFLDSLYGINMTSASPAPLLVGPLLRFLRCRRHDEYHLMIFSHSSVSDWATQERRVEIH